MILKTFPASISLQNQRKLRSTVHDRDVITISRGDGTYQAIPTEDLVPGDVILIPPGGCVMHCDAVLLSGTCIVNESMLTGESVPVTKTPLPQRGDVKYSMKEHGRHTLFCGTKIVQTRSLNNEKVKAIVTSTGFMTTKGSLVSAIMYPPPVDFRFERDSYKFIGFLAFLALIGLVYNVYQRLAHGETGIDIFLHSFDLITICVPPALPAAMTAGIILAQKRLKKRGIYCISPRTINVAGTLNCVCFDKTGTLTEDGLDLWGIVPSLEGSFQSPLKDPNHLRNSASSSTSSGSLESVEPLILMAMATCHSLTRIDGLLGGDPLDLKMFESTGYTLDELSDTNTSKFQHFCPTIVSFTTDSSSKRSLDIGIVRQYPFSSTLQRMAVLCQLPEAENFLFFCKGSPEIVRSLSLAHTIPVNFDDALGQYTGQGYRVIALAYREVDPSSIDKLEKVQREDLEQKLTFLGFVVLENRLKSDTTSVIKQLRDAQIRTIMVTGDNLLTAVSVAKECGMIQADDDIVTIDVVEKDENAKPTLEYKISKNLRVQVSKDVILNVEASNYHFALTGKAWTVIREHYPEILDRILVRGTVYARMSPDQKQQLVEGLQHLGYCVGMCGDGANDCGALKSAFAGISLSETEASVASPFTSKDPSISCVPELIRQGRCALVTSFGIFKFMAGYSITQFISVMILYDIGSNLTDFEFLYIDVFLICALCFFFGNNDPHRGPLFHKPPLISLLSPSPIGSLITQISLVGLFQGLSILLLSQQSFFIPFDQQNNSTGFLKGNIACHENYSVFCVSMFQYIALAIAFAKGKPYRTPFYLNRLFTGIALLVTTLSVWILLQPPSFIRIWLNLLVPESWHFRLILLGLCVTEFIVIIIMEAIIVDYLLIKLTNSEFWKKIRPFKERYIEIMEREDNEETKWPKLNGN